jgi:hypothetical protein
MFVLRQVRLLWLLVTLVITPVIVLPWSAMGGKSIAKQEEEDDDAGADDGEAIALYAPWSQHGRSPPLPLRRQTDSARPPRPFVVHHARPFAPAAPSSVPQSTRVRLQI